MPKNQRDYMSVSYRYILPAEQKQHTFLKGVEM
nr:MAG TPA: hypothetical protein [Caudoviricetes sp.]